MKALKPGTNNEQRRSLFRPCPTAVRPDDQGAHYYWEDLGAVAGQALPRARG